jgi:single-strand DNA-binding protein
MNKKEKMNLPYLNEVRLMGHLTRDPEVLQSAAGNSYAKFAIAVNRFAKKGEEPVTDFFNCVVFGKTAEYVGNWFGKGDAIYVAGEINIDRVQNGTSYTYYTNIIAREVKNVGGKKDKGGSAGSKMFESKKETTKKEPAENDDVPF